jgi:hypothetical protein
LGAFTQNLSMMWGKKVKQLGVPENAEFDAIFKSVENVAKR